MKGSQGFHGSALAEINHSSVLCHLNDEHTQTNRYCEDALTLIKDLFGCQNRHAIKMNQLFHTENTEMINEMKRLKHEP